MTIQIKMMKKLYFKIKFNFMIILSCFNYQKHTKDAVLSSLLY